jgi:hypothetical protein
MQKRVQQSAHQVSFLCVVWVSLHGAFVVMLIERVALLYTTADIHLTATVG